MTETWSLQWSVKSPSGSMLNLRTDRADEMQVLLESVNDLIPAMLAIEQQMTGAGNIAAVIPLAQPQRQAAVGQSYQQPSQSQPGAQPQWQQQPPQQTFVPQQQPQYQQPQQPQQAPQQQQGQAPVCQHGIPAKFVQAGVSKTSGRPFGSFWACSLPRDQQCNFRQQG